MTPYKFQITFLNSVLEFRTKIAIYESQSISKHSSDGDSIIRCAMMEVIQHHPNSVIMVTVMVRHSIIVTILIICK